MTKREEFGQWIKAKRVKIEEVKSLNSQDTFEVFCLVARRRGLRYSHMRRGWFSQMQFTLFEERRKDREEFRTDPGLLLPDDSHRTL